MDVDCIGVVADHKDIVLIFVGGVKVDENDDQVSLGANALQFVKIQFALINVGKSSVVESFSHLLGMGYPCLGIGFHFCCELILRGTRVKKVAKRHLNCCGSTIVACFLSMVRHGDEV